MGLLLKRLGKRYPSLFTHYPHTYLNITFFFFSFQSNRTEKEKKNQIFLRKKINKLKLCDGERLLFFTTQIVVFFQILVFLLRLLREVPANGSKQGNFNLVVWLFCYALLFKSFDMEQSSDELQKILEWEWEEREMCVLYIYHVCNFLYHYNEICLVWVRIYIYIFINF